MILTCDSCQKKFVVPDQAIKQEGRLVQCGTCGNKWKQFPIEIKKKIEKTDNKIKEKRFSKTAKPKKKNKNKTRQIDLYSPEYLAKKHGIFINEISNKKKINSQEKISFGFYNLIIVFLVTVIVLSRGLYFFQDYIVLKLPITEFYIDYFFESIRNIFEIWKNLIITP
jgi:predicted Zn finger-like uncharacterized protein|tara:strand:+ start:88 stop:591 length:504 start_codon:yes stop_codon:yes gene_type:complete